MFNVFSYVKFAKSYFTRKDVLLIGILVIAFLVTRLINLEDFPIFSDEGIYVRWAKIAWKDAGMRFISVTDGRQPLQTWGTIPFLKLFESNALFAGRLFSVTTGFFALSGIYSLAAYLFNKRTAFIAGMLYIFTPYFLFFDRMALVDSAINAFTIWLFFLSIVLVRTLRLDIALITGIVAGFGMLGKSSMRLYIGLMAFAAIFIFVKKSDTFWDYLKNLKNKLFHIDDRKEKWSRLINYLFLYGLVAGMALFIYNIQRLSPYFHYVAEKNKTFILTLPEIMSDPLAHFQFNIRDIPYYISAETGYVFAIFGIVGLVLMYRKNRVLAAYFALWLVIAWFGISTVARVLFPRYVLSLGGLLIVPAAFFVASFKDNTKKYIAIALIVLSVAYFDYTILFQHKDIPFPEIDRGQYLEGWPAGWGVKDIVSYARDKSQEKPVVLVAEGNFGMAGDVLDTYLKPGDEISIRGYWPLDETSLEESQELLVDNHVYVVFPHRNDFPSNWPIELIQKYDKPCKRDAVLPFDKIFGNDPVTKECNSAIYFFELVQSN